MSTSTLRFRDATMPRPPDGLGRGAVLALLVHLLLIAAIAFGVNWRVREPEGVSAELWSAVPQIAAPRAVAPPPKPAPAPAPAPEVKPPPVPKATPEPPPVADAQIAIEKAKREAAKREAAEREEQRQLALKREAQKAEAQKLEAQRAEARQQELQKQKAQREKALAEAKEAEERKKELAEKARKEEAAVVAQREAYLKRMQGQANATGDADSTGTAARTSGPSANYAGRIKARIKPNIVFTDAVSGNPLATVEVRCASDGTITSRKLVRSSGNAAWDDAVLRAIDKTETLPRDTDGRVPPVVQIEFKPRD